MKITITLHCPDCQGTTIKKNGKKMSKKQNYFCRDYSRQFIGDHALSYKGWHSELIHKVLLMLVRGVGIRDIAEIEGISIRKVLSVLVNFALDNHVTGKENTVGIEGNNCRLRHRIRRAFRKTCCFSKNYIII